MEIESRVVALENDVSKVKTDLAVILSNYATKQDVAELRADLQSLRVEFQKEINTLTWKMYGFGTALVAAVYFIARNVH
jgi:hypothetical protein